MHSVEKRTDMRSISRVSRMAAAAVVLALAVFMLTPFLSATRALAATPAVSSYSQNVDMPETGQVFSYAQITDLHIGRGVGDYGTAGYDDAPYGCLLYTSPSPRDRQRSRMPSSA